MLPVRRGHAVEHVPPEPRPRSYWGWCPLHQVARKPGEVLGGCHRSVTKLPVTVAVRRAGRPVRETSRGREISVRTSNGNRIEQAREESLAHWGEPWAASLQEEQSGSGHAEGQQHVARPARGDRRSRNSGRPCRPRRSARALDGAAVGADAGSASRSRGSCRTPRSPTHRAVAWARSAAVVRVLRRARRG